MNKKGFVFIEMIVTTVILIVALLLLYSTYSKVIANEKQRLYFDDIAYVYKAENVRDVVADSIDNNNFYKNINENKNGYVYLFGPQSDIFNEDKRQNIHTVWDHYHVYAMGYISISDIPSLKSCLNNKTTGLSADALEKCNSTKKHLKSYSKAYISDFLKTLDVDYNNESKMYIKDDIQHDGILIILFSETKNGDKAENSLTYNKCIQDKATDSRYGYCPDCSSGSITNAQKQEAVKEYNADEKVSFDMLCEAGYNIVWVYY